ncbi:MAG: ATP-dependent Clp protease proteolytic subunit [Oscillospiraceae bacterium]|jgi:ATP-dependent protease ClpP protease subunit|nr:ATP-dependent Clp protease proteolytic subunit [Oscillospiraceae bacterium]
MSEVQTAQPAPPLPKRHNLFYTGDIYPQSVNNIRSACIQALQQSASGIRLFLSSEGGQLSPALSLYHFLRALSIPLTTYNCGTVESAAVPIFMAGEARLAAPSSWFLIHSFLGGFYANQADAPRLSERNQNLNRHAELYEKILEERMNRPDSKLHIYERCRGDLGALMIGPDTALDVGILTGITPADGLIAADDANISIAP